MPLIKKNALSLLLFLIAGVLTAVIWFALPHDREVKSLGLLLFKLIPFVIATFAIANLDTETCKQYRVQNFVVPMTFLVFFCFFVPKIFFVSDDYPTLYYFVLTMTPFIILSLTLAYRLGGGSGGHTIRIAFAMLLFMLSGLEDLAFLKVNHQTDPHWATIPEVWTWASHMTVFLGHAPTKYQAYTFIAVHVVLALLVLFLPTRFITQSAFVKKMKMHFSGSKHVLTRNLLRHS